MEGPRFSVIIVNYNAGAYLQGAVDSLKRQSFRSFEVIVLDNASEDGSFDQLDTDGLPAVQRMAEPVNHGFARGNNLAAQRARGEWLALLNPDAEAAEDWLERIDAALNRHQTIGVFACRQISLDDPQILDGVGDNYLAFGYPWRGGFGWPSTTTPQEGHVFGPCGASAIYRRDLFERFAGFDERLFCYCEDVDLSFRLTLADERCLFLPDAVVHHAGSAITGQMSEFTISHGFRNAVWVYFKNMPSVLLLVTLPLNLLLSSYLLIRSIPRGRFLVTGRALWRGYRQAVSVRRSGAADRKQRRIGLPKLASMLSWNPWAMRQHRPHVSPLDPKERG